MEVESSNLKIRVAIRKRPLTKKETGSNERDVIDATNDSIIVREQKVKLDLTKYTEEHVFKFDNVFSEQSSNQEVYDEAVKPIVQAAFSGAKVSCFAYGQTGSGKTYTMIGDGRNPGLYLLAAEDIFKFLKSPQNPGLTAMVSYFEIYCGKLYDLLNERKLLHAREDARQNVNIINLRRFDIQSPANLFELISFGNSVRVTSATGKNADSSRSHAVLQIYLVKEKKLKGLLSFIDLAGNERGGDTYDHDEKTRQDGAEISKSLLALKECIRALDQNLKHVPFRGSKLTMVLKDSFMGNSRTVMIGNISPAISSTEYTLNTLRYADRVKELKKDPKDRIKNELMLPRQPQNIRPVPYNDGSEPVRDPPLNEGTEIQGFVEEEIMLDDVIDQLTESHQKVINEILEDEEKLLHLHKSHIKLMTGSLHTESNLLEEVDKPGSDIESYINSLSKILEEKIASIVKLKGALNGFSEKLAQERQISEKINEIDRGDDDEVDDQN